MKWLISILSGFLLGICVIASGLIQAGFKQLNIPALVGYLLMATALAAGHEGADMNNLLLLVLMFVTGILLAVIYLGALWLTLKNLHQRRHAALWLISSMLVRMVLLVFSFYLIMGDGHWEHLLAALSGFIAMRLLTTSSVQRELIKSHSNRETTV